MEKPPPQEEPLPSATPSNAAPSIPEKSFKLIDDTHSISESITSYLTENTDFQVVGVLGLQGVGKSTVCNALATAVDGNIDFNPVKTSLHTQPNAIFRMQTFEKQMLSEHCTTGLNIWISPERLILIDCQPLLSASMLDRSIQTDKKTAVEFNNSLEDTLEMHALQIIGFLSNVCHKVLLVQDYFVDSSLMRLVHAAEMLKPSSPAFVTFPEDETTPPVVDYFPDLIFVHNKTNLEDFSGANLRKMSEFYTKLFSKSQFNVVNGGNVGAENGYTLNHVPKDEDASERADVVLLPDFELAEATENGFRSVYEFEDLVMKFRRGLLTTRTRPLTTSRLTEKTWFNHLTKSWDAVKTSGFYSEYARFM